MRRLVVRTAIAAFTIAGLGACVTIPERAWVNGRAMSSSAEYQRAMRGDMSLQTQRALYSASNPLRLSSPVRWTPSSSYDR
jgi:hypothetical protein